MEESEQDVPPLSQQNSLLQMKKLKTETADLNCTTTTELTPSSSEEIKREQLLIKLDRDLIASDLLINLFISALKSYKRDSVLRPFPSICCNRSNTREIISKNFDKLECLADSIPGVHSVADCYLSSDVVQLLLWILDTKHFTVKNVEKNVFSHIKELTGQTVETAWPTHIFQIESSPEINAKFDSERRGRELIYAYHGSRIENFHSILHNGLRNHMNKNSLFGEGTYLSSELSVCLPYCQTGQGWSKSQIGDKLSCVAVCEIITDPKVRCQTRKKEGRNRSGSQNIPEKYYIVQNDELLRVKYLLLYAEKSGKHRECVGDDRMLGGWLSRHRFVILMISYLVILLAIGMGNSNKLKVLKKYFTW
ncbi:Protein mono-ADP-ribosyltransferase parp16 [Chamberlinius hualienensis]